MPPSTRRRASPSRRRAASPAAKKPERTTKKPKSDADVWLNTDGRHGSPWYCRGRPRPLFRGWLHVSAALCSPIYSAYQLSLCQNMQEAAAVALACLGATCMFGFSGRYHRYNFKDEEAEEFAGSLDYCGIYLQITFSGAPLYLLALPSPNNWLVIGGMGACAIVGMLIALTPYVDLGRHGGTLVYCLMGCLGGLPIVSSTRTGDSVWSQLLDSERALLKGCAVSYLIGSQVYAHSTPKLLPRVFGFP